MKTRQAKKILKETFRSLKAQAKQQGSSLLKIPYNRNQISKACSRLKRRRIDFFDASAVMYAESLSSLRNAGKCPAFAGFEHLKQLA